MDAFNHHMMTLARDSRGLTQAELADRISIVQGTLSKVETGQYVPSPEFVANLGQALSYPASFFLQSGQPYGFPPFHFRKRKKLSAKTLGKIVAEMNIRRMHIKKLLISFQIKSTRFIPEIDLDEFYGRSNQHPDIENVARAVREGWMLQSGPVPNMIELIETNGGVVIPCDFGTGLIDAMSQRIDGLPVLFFVNTVVPTDRLRHTLAHELGHMVLHTVGLKDDDEMEREADAFAGAFMLPASEIRSQLRRFDLHHLANMKSYWKVSMASIAVRADRLRLITPYQSKMFWIEMSKLGYRKREPNEPPAETPTALRRMVEFHQRQLGYSSADMAALLDILPIEFDRLYGNGALGLSPSTKPRLRLVN
jgi:Zn-dependent peptidase ImmA (M78 family)/transcriptional regulator with XRE-family HTH domain